MSRADPIARDARELADRLDRERRKRDAEIVRALLRSHSTARESASRLYKDNIELRKWRPEDNG